MKLLLSCAEVCATEGVKRPFVPHKQVSRHNDQVLSECRRHHPTGGWGADLIFLSEPPVMFCSSSKFKSGLPFNKYKMIQH